MRPEATSASVCGLKLLVLVYAALGLVYAALSY
jgi:hypothetical protein